MLTSVFGVSCVHIVECVRVCAEGSLVVLGASLKFFAGVITMVLQLIGDRDVDDCLTRCFQCHLLYSNGCALERARVCFVWAGGRGAVGLDFFFSKFFCGSF